MMKKLAILLAAFLLSCSDPMVQVVKSKYPNCDVLKIDETDSGRYDVIIQCGNTPPRKIRFIEK